MTDAIADAQYRDYLASVSALLGLEREYAVAATAAESAGKDRLNAALRAQRESGQLLRDVDERLTRLHGHTVQLATKIGDCTPTPASLSWTDPADVEQFLRGVGADLKAAESAWSWVERARRDGPPRQVASTVESPVDSVGTDGQLEATRSQSTPPRRLRTALVAAMVALVVVVGIVIAVVR